MIYRDSQFHRISLQQLEGQVWEGPPFYESSLPTMRQALLFLQGDYSSLYSYAKVNRVKVTYAIKGWSSYKRINELAN